MDKAENVLRFFKEICAIPRSSYDEQRISDYLMDFAAKRGLQAERDEMNNVIIRKPSTVPGCKCPPVIIQGHMDMVYVKAENCTRDYEEGIAVYEKNGWLHADGTTRGADDGVAVAYALALLDSDKLPHPDLEVVITVQEEVGLAGAQALDCSGLRAKYMINMDTEKEGIFFASCAGAFRHDLEIPIEREQVSGLTELKVSLGGMLGGHSGMEIHLGRGNAIVLMGRLLSQVCEEGVRLYSISCNGKMNAIASRCEAVLYIENTKIDSVLDCFNHSVTAFNKELKGIDAVELQTVLGERDSQNCYTEESMRKVVAALSLLPNGVITMSHTIPGLVQTSANPGIVTQNVDKVTVSSCVRSTRGSRKDELRNKLNAIAFLVGGQSICSNDYPQWEYKEKSPLRDLAMDSYKELFGIEAKATAIHAGLECGFFDQRMPGLDIISFGPDQENVHTPNERVNLNSLEHVWKLLLRILERLSKME